MWPWGHAAVGYLVYSLYTRLDGRRPVATGIIALAVGTQFPDLVDKPLAWTVAVLPYGRSLAHSLLTFVVVGATIILLTRRYHRSKLGIAFALGYVSHIFADGIGAMLQLDPMGVTYLLWPLVPLPEPELGQSFMAHILNLSLTPLLALEFGLVGLAAVVWARDGYPLVATVRIALKRRLRADSTPR